MPLLKKSDQSIDGVYIIEPKIFNDNRGFFYESYNKKEFEKIGIKDEFVQDNHSKSKKGVLRGLHFQNKHSQGKLVRVIKGEVFDVAVDLRKNSSTYGKYTNALLSEDNKKMFYIPKGFAHGFLVLSDEVEFLYKTTDYYYPEYDSGIRWDDPDIGVEWPFEEYSIKKEEISLSDKDKHLLLLKEIDYFYEEDEI